MRPVGDNASPVEDDQAFDQRQERRAVCDQNQGIFADHLGQLLLDDIFAARVHRAGRLVHDQDVGPAQQRARHRDRLALAARQAVAALADRQVVAFRVLADEVIDAGQLRCLQRVGIVGVGRGDGDVVAHRAAKQEQVLRHVADIAPEIDRVDLSNVGPVDHDCAFGRRIEADHHLGDRRLARPDTTDEADRLARADLEADASEDLDVLVRIGEADVFEADLAAQIGAVQKHLIFRQLGRLFHDGVQRAQRGHRLMIAGHQLRRGAERAERTARQDDAGDQAADRELALADQENPDQHHGHRRHLLDEEREGRRQICEEARALRRRCRYRDEAFPQQPHAAFGADALDRLQAVERFDQHAVLVFAFLQVLLDQVAQR